MKDTDKLLNKIDNLMSDDSAILRSYDNKINKANKEKKRIEDEKIKIEEDIANLQTDIDDITKASELTDRFANLEEFEAGLKKLGNSCDYITKLNKELELIPSKIEELENKVNDLKDKAVEAANSIEEREDEISKLDVDLSDAKRYQENLIDLVEVAKTGDINKTREEVLEILRHVGFSDKESLSAAKIVLFPEEDLIPYFRKGKKIDKVEVVEDVKESIVIPKEIKEELELPKMENKPVEEEVQEEVDEIISNEKPQETYEEDELVDFNTLEIFDQEAVNKYDVGDLLRSNGFATNKFNKEELVGFEEEDSETITRNIDLLLNNNFSKDFIYRYPKVLIDHELGEKFNFIIDELNKDIEDVKMNPLILISYSLSDFKKLVEITTKTGIKAQEIPLIVYIKGLQGFLQNYVELVNNSINIDDNELSKLACILTINPIDFKMSLDTINNYHISLKKANGKYALMCLAKSSLQLMNEIDLIIEIGEEDILKSYPEVLSSDVMALVNRLKFIRKAGIPYKAESYGEVIYQSYVMNQEKLNKIVEKKLDLHEILNVNETNDVAKTLIENTEAFACLDNMSEEDANKVAQSNSYKNIIKSYKQIEDKNNSYVIDGIYFSKNKVIRNINYLLSIDIDISKDILLLSALFYNARKSTEEMNNVINKLDIKVDR